MIAHCKPESLDWADDIAVEIIADVMRGGPFRETRDLIAAKLRAIQSEGKVLGNDETEQSILKLFGHSDDLQRETQKDADEEREGLYR